VKLPDDVYSKVKHLILNTSEAELLCDLPAGSISASSDLDGVAKRLIDKGVDVVVITLGGDGAFFQTRARAKNSAQGQTIPATRVQVVDTTAAGDTFVGAYAVTIAKGRPGKGEDELICHAVQWAIRASAKTVQKKGAQSAIPWLEEIKV
jgi:ribokinase